MRTENEEIRDHLKYLALLARDYPSQAAAASVMGGTSRLMPVEWLGSTMTGRCDSSCSIGTAARSSVFLV